jgi:hypothetical protein
MPKKPINRMQKFFSEKDFNLEIDLGREYYREDTNFTITYYKVNVIESKTHKLYGNAKPSQKRFFKPVDLVVAISFSNANTKNMSNGGIIRQDVDNFTFSVYNDELTEKNITLDRGDYFSYDHGDKTRYYEVTDISFINDISQTIGGYKPYYKKVVGIPVKEDVVLNIEEGK